MHFPAQGTVMFEPPALLGERGLVLRAAGDHDLPFLAQLYAHTRAEELAGVPWPESMRKAFLDSQFALQHRHYVAHYPHADFMVVQQQARPVGRFYLARADDGEDDLIVDISLLPQWRGQGIGAALIEAAAIQAATRGRGVHLHVLHANGAARRLYERLGFRVDGDTGTHLHMRRAPAATAVS
jgi:ribosomal protein S18 acetylase RimI-like enzyme